MAPRARPSPARSRDSRQSACHSWAGERTPRILRLTPAPPAPRNVSGSDNKRAIQKQREKGPPRFPLSPRERAGVARQPPTNQFFSPKHASARPRQIRRYKPFSRPMRSGVPITSMLPPRPARREERHPSDVPPSNDFAMSESGDAAAESPHPSGRTTRSTAAPSASSPPDARQTFPSASRTPPAVQSPRARRAPDERRHEPARGLS